MSFISNTLLRGVRKNFPLSSSIISSSALRSRYLSTEFTDKLEFLQVSQSKPFVYNVALNRPEKRNCVNSKLWSEIHATFEELNQDPDCRVIIFSGNGKMFCSGIDVNDLASIGQIVQGDEDAARKGKYLYHTIKKIQNSISAIEKCIKPVIVACHGGSVGGGVDLITAGDVRLCSEDAFFQVKEVDLGLAADIGTLQRLPKIIGSASLVNELCFTARKMLSDEALSCGLVSKVYPDHKSLMEEASKMAELIASKSPVAVQSTKANLIYSRDHSVDDGLDYVARWNSLHLQAEDVTVAAMSSIMRSPEPPEFKKL